MLRFFRLIPFVFALASSAHAAEKGQLDSSPALFSVLAAINAAGYDADVSSAANHPLRQKVRDYLATKKDLSSVIELKNFFARHHLANSDAELSQYISFALITDGSPNFRYTVAEQDLPPDVARLEGFRELMVRFYEEARMENVWRQVQPAIDQEIERYHEPVTRALMTVNGYLRNPTSGFVGRRFQIYVDLLGAPNQIQTRSYRDDYFVVLTASSDPPIEDIRHAYLHYLLDPLATKYSAILEKKKGLKDYAQGSGILESYYKEDFLLLATECLIKAIESRLTPGGAEKKQAVVDQALREGFILTPYFAEQLPGYEKDDRSMRIYFPDMVTAIDLGKEEKRLAKVEFATQRPVRRLHVVPAEKPVELSPQEKLFADAQKLLYRDKNLPRAKDAYLRLLQESGADAFRAKSYFGLARIAVLEKRPAEADELFQKTLALSPDDETKSWSLLYRGRLADSQERHEEAETYYKAALAVAGAPDAVKEAAGKGLTKAPTTPK